MTDAPGRNRLAAVVHTVDREASFVLLDAEGTTLAARLWSGVVEGQAVTVAVRPEDVVLCTDVPGKISTRNVLPGVVLSVGRRPEGALVSLDVGVPLTALVTARTVDDMGIEPGCRLVALVKATALVPVEAVDARVEVSVIGPHGTLDARKLALLEAIHGSGSLAAAAREIGVTYRTAWLWVMSMHETWGAALVTTVQGGAGGGGALLTPAAQGVLELARRCEQQAQSELPASGERHRGRLSTGRESVRE
jgi:molybdate transport system regulatory protein